MNDALKAAVYHAAKGCLPESIDVPVGLYNLSGYSVVISLPDGAAVERGDGTDGGGFDTYAEKQKVLTNAVVTRFLERAGLVGPALKDAWTAAILDVMTSPVKPSNELPDEAVLAAQELEASTPVGLIGRRKTAAKRIGVKAAKIVIIPSSIDPGEVSHQYPPA